MKKKDLNSYPDQADEMNLKIGTALQNIKVPPDGLRNLLYQWRKECENRAEEKPGEKDEEK